MRLIKFFLFSIFILDIIVSVESEKATKKGKTSKKTKESPVEEFLPFALDFLEDINTRLCLREDLSAVCERVAGLVARGTPFIDAIAPYYYINFRAMTLAYPLVLAGLDILSIQVIRVHRVLGYGNNLRLQGNTEDTVNRAYWSHWNVLKLEDENFLPPGDGIETYCRYISNEYEMLKAFAVDNFEVDFSSTSPVFGATPMYNACMSTDEFMSYIIRSDWEHHRREMIGSLMSSKKTKSIVVYTIWHWESLFTSSIPDTSELVIQQLFNSFTAFIPIP